MIKDLKTHYNGNHTSSRRNKGLLFDLSSLILDNGRILNCFQLYVLEINKTPFSYAYSYNMMKWKFFFITFVHEKRYSAKSSYPAAEEITQETRQIVAFA